MEDSYLSAEMQSVYSKASADWAIYMCVCVCVCVCVYDILKCDVE